jgi:predicted transcriptional regulator YheO
LHPLVRALVPLVKGLSLALGPDCEVVLHDVSNPEHSIVAIENGSISGRKVGDPLTDYGLFSLKTALASDIDYLPNFLARTRDGRRMRCNTLFLRDEQRTVVGYLCLNCDMTRAEVAKGLLDHLTAIASPVYSEHFAEGPSASGEDLLQRNLRLIRELLGKPLHLLNRPERLEAVRHLEEKGFFLLKGAVEAFAQEAGVSVFTVYRYLRETRSDAGAGTEGTLPDHKERQAKEA